MAHLDHNSNSRGPTSAPVWGVAALLLAGVAWWLCQTGARAGDESNVGRDLAAAVRVRKALESDAELRPLKINLHVKMTKGIAQLSGAVPLAAARQRVIRVAAQVPGVLQVEGRGLYVAKPLPGTATLMLPFASDQPQHTRSASPNPAAGEVGRLTGREPMAMRTPPRSSPPRRVTLLAPEGIASAAPPPAQTDPLAAAIDRVRRANEHFRKIRTEQHGGTVRILAGDTAGEHLTAFAQAIARLPGVERVTIASPRR